MAREKNVLSMLAVFMTSFGWNLMHSILLCVGGWMPCREGGAFYDYFFVDLNYLIYLLLSVGRFCEADICLVLRGFSAGGYFAKLIYVWLRGDFSQGDALRSRYMSGFAEISRRRAWLLYILRYGERPYLRCD